MCVGLGYTKVYTFFLINFEFLLKYFQITDAAANRKFDTAHERIRKRFKQNETGTRVVCFELS